MLFFLLPTQVDMSYSMYIFEHYCLQARTNITTMIMCQVTMFVIQYSVTKAVYFYLLLSIKILDNENADFYWKIIKMYIAI